MSCLTTHKTRRRIWFVFSPEFSYDRNALQPAVEDLNRNFGGQEQVIPFVIFTNAGLDPWIGHGVSDYNVEDGAVIFIYCEYRFFLLTKLDPVNIEFYFY